MTENTSAKGIQRGEVIHIHDQSTTLVSLSIARIKNINTDSDIPLVVF
jgi:hypothetical protein